MIFLSKCMIFRFGVYRFPKIHIFPQPNHPSPRQKHQHLVRNQPLVGSVGEFLADFWVSVVFFSSFLAKKSHLTLSGLLFTARRSGGTCHGTRSGARPGMESSGTDNSQNWTKLAVFKRICSPLLGEMIQFDNIIFLQMGWFNHHLANVVAILSGGFSTKISSCRNSVIHSLRLYMLNSPGTCFLDWKVACLYHLPCS